MVYDMLTYIWATLFFISSLVTVRQSALLKFYNCNFLSPGLSKFCDSCPVDVSPYMYTHMLAVSFVIVPTSSHNSDSRALNAGGSVAHAFYHLPQSCGKYLNSQATDKTTANNQRTKLISMDTDIYLM
jgi:hypothetical protein